MFRFILIFTITLLLLSITVLSYHTSLNNYSKYFVNKKSSNSLFKATYLGASSILISDGETTILTDGFITRPSIYSILFTKINPNTKLIKETLKKINIKRIDAIITLHSHHDHAMDSPIIAHQTGAFIIGSLSTANIAKSYNFENIKIISGKKSFHVGDFTITVIPSLHTVMSKNISSIVGIGKEIENEFTTPTYFTSYKEGGTYALFIEHQKGNIFINGSTNFIKGSLSAYKAQTVFLGIANLSDNSKEFQEEYFKELVISLEAKKVIPIHWDDFTKNINENTRPMPTIFDDFKSNMDFIITQSKKSNISLEILRIFDTTNLDK